MGFLGNFFAEMGNMGVEPFELSCAEHCTVFFLSGLGALCDRPRGGLLRVRHRVFLRQREPQKTALCAIKGFMAVSLFTVVPVRLYELRHIAASLTAGITGYGTSIGEAATEIVDSLSAALIR